MTAPSPDWKSIALKLFNRTPDEKSSNKCEVTIVIPFHNASGTIERALLSVRNQGNVRCEVIIVNDGSTLDETFKLKEICNQYPCKVINGKRTGAAAARNLGIQFSKSEFISFLDADDELFPNALASQLSMLRQQKRAALCYGRVSISYKNANVPNEVTAYRKSVSFAEMAGAFPILTSSNMMVRRTALSDVGLFEEALKRASDHEWAIRLSLHAKWMAVGVDAIIVRKHLNPWSLWADPEKFETAWRDVLASIKRIAPTQLSAQKSRIEALLHLRLSKYCAKYARKNHLVFFHLAKALAADSDYVTQKYGLKPGHSIGEYLSRAIVSIGGLRYDPV